MGRPVNVEVSLDEVKGNSTRLIKKFTKKVKKSKILELYRNKLRHVKPSKKRRLEKKRKKENARKAEQARKAKRN